MALKPDEGKKAVLERIAGDLKRLEKEAARIDEGFLAYLLAQAANEAANQLDNGNA